jgi:predicted transcriptional regulator
MNALLCYISDIQIVGYSMSITKEEAIRLISGLPEEVTWEDIMYRLYVKRKIEDGIKAAEEGRTVSHDEVKELFAPE